MFKKSNGKTSNGDGGLRSSITDYEFEEANSWDNVVSDGIIRKRNDMRKSLLIIVLLLFTYGQFSFAQQFALQSTYKIVKAEGNRSVTLKIEVDSFICQETQMVYLYDIVGNDYIIYDSIMLVPDRYQYQLYGRTDFETELCLMFSKRGPCQMFIVAMPGDSLTVNISAKDNICGIYRKHLTKESAHQKEVLDISDMVFADDKTYEEKQSYYANILETTDSPYLANLAWLYFKGEKKEEYLDLISKRFPNYLPIRWKVERYKFPEPSEEAKRMSEVVKRVLFSR